jgi:molecular chaperone DnaK
VINYTGFLFLGLDRNELHAYRKHMNRLDKRLQSKGWLTMGKIIGIDLGTTNSVVAIMNGKDPQVIVNEEGDRTTPSIVAWDDSNNIMVGKIAKRQALTNKNTIYSAKRLIGLKYKECEKEAKKLAYTTTNQPNGDICVSVNDKNISPQEVSAQVLRKLKKSAEDYLGEEVTEAVITVPA